MGKTYWPMVERGASAETWLKAVGITPVNGKVILYKAVNQELHSAKSRDWARATYSHTPRMTSTYEPGATLTCPDFKRDGMCGQGLHLSPTPAAASQYYRGAKRYMACEVKVKDINVLHNWTGSAPKIKVPQLKVLYEVAISGKQLRTTLVGAIAVSRKSGFSWDVLHEEDGQVVLKRCNSNKYKIVKVSNLRKSFSLI